METCEVFQSMADHQIECSNSYANGPSSPSSLVTAQQEIACNETLSSCSTIDGLSADILQVSNWKISISELCMLG